MRSMWIMVLAAAALTVPVSASAVINQTDYKNASKSNAFGKCVSKNAKTVDKIHSTAVEQCKAAGTKPLGKCVSSAEHQAQVEQQDAIVNAAKQCRTERAANPGVFRQNYGTNHNKRNAFGKCVSKHVKEG